MKTKSLQTVSIICLLLTTTLSLPSIAHSQATQPAQQTIFAKLIAAIHAKDREAFLSFATDDMKQAVTPSIMDQMNNDLAPHLDKGYQPTYLCELKQEGCLVRLWKLSFTDNSDDMVIRIVLKDNKLAGFFRQ